eukprot:PhM_4_TR18828/c0_g1_i4/m.95924
MQSRGSFSGVQSSTRRLTGPPVECRHCRNVMDATHELNCGYRHVRCKDCGETMTAMVLVKTHRGVCPRRVVLCSGCYGYTTADNLQHHQARCAYRMGVCVKCRRRLPGKDWAHHVRECAGCEMVFDGGQLTPRREAAVRAATGTSLPVLEADDEVKSSHGPRSRPHSQQPAALVAVVPELELEEVSRPSNNRRAGTHHGSHHHIRVSSDNFSSLLVSREQAPTSDRTASVSPSTRSSKRHSYDSVVVLSGRDHRTQGEEGTETATTTTTTTTPIPQSVKVEECRVQGTSVAVGTDVTSSVQFIDFFGITFAVKGTSVSIFSHSTTSLCNAAFTSENSKNIGNVKSLEHGDVIQHIFIVGDEVPFAWGRRGLLDDRARQARHACLDVRRMFDIDKAIENTYDGELIELHCRSGKISPMFMARHNNNSTLTLSTCTFCSHRIPEPAMITHWRDHCVKMPRGVVGSIGLGLNSALQIMSVKQNSTLFPAFIPKGGGEDTDEESAHLLKLYDRVVAAFIIKAPIPEEWGEMPLAHRRRFCRAVLVNISDRSQLLSFLSDARVGEYIEIHTVRYPAGSNMAARVPLDLLSAPPKLPKGFLATELMELLDGQQTSAIASPPMRIVVSATALKNSYNKASHHHQHSSPDHNTHHHHHHQTSTPASFFNEDKFSHIVDLAFDVLDVSERRTVPLKRFGELCSLVIQLTSAHDVITDINYDDNDNTTTNPSPPPPPPPLYQSEVDAVLEALTGEDASESTTSNCEITVDAARPWIRHLFLQKFSPLDFLDMFHNYRTDLRSYISGVFDLFVRRPRARGVVAAGSPEDQYARAVSMLSGYFQGIEAISTPFAAELFRQWEEKCEGAGGEACGFDLSPTSSVGVSALFGDSTGSRPASIQSPLSPTTVKRSSMASSVCSTKPTATMIPFEDFYDIAEKVLLEELRTSLVTNFDFFEATLRNVFHQNGHGACDVLDPVGVWDLTCDLCKWCRIGGDDHEDVDEPDPEFHDEVFGEENLLEVGYGQDDSGILALSITDGSFGSHASSGGSKVITQLPPSRFMPLCRGVVVLMYQRRVLTNPLALLSLTHRIYTTYVESPQPSVSQALLAAEAMVRMVGLDPPSAIEMKALLTATMAPPPPSSAASVGSTCSSSTTDVSFPDFYTFVTELFAC